MWFDVTAALAEIEGEADPAPEARPAATSATSATQAPDARPVSQMSQVSQPPEARQAAPHVANVASVATPPARQSGDAKAEAAPRVANVADVATPRCTPSRPEAPDAFTHGRSPGGRPLTWTGRVVSLETWRSLSEAERHGPRGLVWCGIRRAWVQPSEAGRPETS